MHCPSTGFEQGKYSQRAALESVIKRLAVLMVGISGIHAALHESTTASQQSDMSEQSTARTVRRDRLKNRRSSGFDLSKLDPSSIDFQGLRKSVREFSESPRIQALMGAAFLMATSAIGPGFLTQTAVFTEKLGTDFAAVILMSVILDIIAQMNVWRVIVVSQMRAQDIANKLLRHLGTVLTVAIVLGGIAFNIGNVAGAGLGMNTVLKVTVTEGAVTSALIAIAIFLSKEAGKAMDKFAQYLGFLMIMLMVYVAVTSSPPVVDALTHAVAPTKFDFFAMITIVGGTVGGYISFSGGHRLLEAGVSGKENLQQATRSAIGGILVASIMRVCLFFAALGVVSAGHKLNSLNPTSSVFHIAAGSVGVRLFAIVMWSAAISSVVGSAYTSISFLRSIVPWVNRNPKAAIVLFITFATTLFTILGKPPVQVMVVAGAINGFILPLSLGVILVAAYRKDVVGDYKQPWWLTVLGAAVLLVMLGATIYTLFIKK